MVMLPAVTPEASAASERAAELARLRFSEGVTAFLQVLDAQRTELEAQDRLAQGRPTRRRRTRRCTRR